MLPPMTQQAAAAIWAQRDAINVKTLTEWRAFARSQPRCANNGWAGVARYLRQHGSFAYVLGADDTVTRCTYRNGGLYTAKPVSIHAEQADA